MSIAKYIGELLYRYDCVIVPEFGAFLTQRKSAQIYAPVFHAPSKAISFNEQIQHNDGLLASHIAKNESLTYDNALIYINKEVTALKAALNAKEFVAFDAIGTFSLNNEGSVQFTATNNTNYLTDSFGLSSFVSHGITREKLTNEVIALEEKVPELTITPERKKRKTSYLPYAAAALLLLSVGGFFGKQYIDNQYMNANAAVANEAQKNVIQEASFDLGTMPTMNISLPEVTPEPKGKYHIVAGAFRFEENAEKKIAELKDMGYSPSRIGVNKYGLHQVVYMSTDNAQDALKELRKIRASHHKSAWLLVKKLD